MKPTFFRQLGERGVETLKIRTGSQKTWRVAACALAAVWFLGGSAVPGKNPPPATGVTLTPVGTPVWQPVDLHVFAAPQGDDSDNFAEFLTTITNILPPPNHVLIPAISGVGPGAPHAPPYDHEMSNGVANAGFVGKTVFSSTDFKLPQSVWLAFMVVPNTNSPTGTSPDFASGPIIPETAFPIRFTGDTLRNGTSFDSAWDFSLPQLSSITNPATGQPFSVQGQSHVPWFAAEAVDFFTTASEPSPDGHYQFTFTGIDKTGNGWNISVPFDVVIHDLAVTTLKAPKTISLSTTTAPVTSAVTVQIQNLGSSAETIPDLQSLANLVNLNIESLAPSSCPSPSFAMAPPKTGFPLVLSPKKKLSVVFNVTFNCANDPLQSTKTESHADFRYTVHLNLAALGGGANEAPQNGDCPRGPSGTDKGCGNKTTSGTLGGDVLTDVVKK